MRTVDLFAGCGGLSTGFQQAGFEVSLAVELWEPARLVYEANCGRHVLSLDLNDVKKAVRLIRREKPDILIGGPPCQEFSPAGPRIEGDKAEMTNKFAEIVIGARPEWFVLENVPAIASSSAWDSAKNKFEDAGYGISETVLNAAYFGVPQLRKRFFAVGRLGENSGFIDYALNKQKSLKPMSIRDYLDDELGIDFYYRHPRNWGRQGIYSINEPSPTIRSTNRKVPPGYKPHPNDAGPIHLAKPLTPEQRARIQTFSSNFKFTGFDTWKNIMIANAVPVQLALHVANAIKTHRERELEINDPAFRNWLSTDFEYTDRTISNVISRLRRGSKMIGHALYENEILLAITALDAKLDFQKLQPSVRSQIRRAFRLRMQYMAAQQV